MTKNKSSLQKKKKAASLKLRKTAGFWRRVRDSNPRSLSEHDFSRVAPSTTRTTLQYISKHQASEIPRKKERTDGENYGIKFSDLSCENKSNQWFRLLCYHINTTLSSQPRYDHFDTPPCPPRVIVPQNPATLQPFYPLRIFQLRTDPTDGMIFL